jgi:hypothetical protein
MVVAKKMGHGLTRFPNSVLAVEFERSLFRGWVFKAVCSTPDIS